ncbi:hypothetical protein [Bacillus velezensis]|uniref:hypothetical protein n=1 Tax=Bacillus velezensis TaxID=492670 RepID=UPI0018E744C9|nr:hypothetical protein [Bacillus velezensis]
MKKTVIGIAITLVIVLAFAFSTAISNTEHNEPQPLQNPGHTKQLADPPVGMSYKVAEPKITKTEKLYFIKKTLPKL